MRKVQIPINLAPLIVAIVLSGCELAKIGDPIVVSDVEEEFRISPWENLALNQRTFQFRIETIEREPCSNAVIDLDIRKTGKSIRVSLKDILAPADCIPGDAPALASADAGNLPNGTYDLSIDLKQTVVHKGRMTAFDDRFAIPMDSTDGFVFFENELMRVPDGTIWGYISYQEREDESISLDFLEELEAISEPRTFAQGYYGYFKIADQSGKIQISEAPQSIRIKQFIYHYQGEDGRQLQDLTDRFREAFGDRIDLRVFNSRGEEF